MKIYTGKVIDTIDEKFGDRIKVKVEPFDHYKKDSDIPFSFPIIPKMIHITPKVGEACLIMVSDESMPNKDRYYLGPIISQPQKLSYDDYYGGGTSLLSGSIKGANPSPDVLTGMTGCFCSTEDIAIYGRKNSDIILSDTDIRIRCGSRLTENDGTVHFNKVNPSFIKLKHYPTALSVDNVKNNNTGVMDRHETVDSTATISAHHINLVSQEGNPGFTMSDTNEQINDDEMKKIIQNAHCLPYGDELVAFLKLFIKMFKSHTHKYTQLKPCPNTDSILFDETYNENNIGDKLLSKHVRIN